MSDNLDTGNVDVQEAFAEATGTAAKTSEFTVATDPVKSFFFTEP